MRGTLLAALVSIALGGCQSSAGSPLPDGGQRKPRDPTAEDYVAPALPTAKVMLKDAFGGSHLVEVEVAHTPASRARGLMWRRSLEEGKGMLFIFPEEEEHGFWMKNTLIPLDMIFIDGRRTILGIVKHAQPRSLSSRGVDEPSTYVLEVPGGWSDKIGLRAGSQVELQGTSMIPVR